MHMKPFSAADITSSKEPLFEITKQQMQKLIILLSICFFTIATELRFIDSQDQLLKTLTNQSEKYKQSEVYHLKAIELVCRYIPSPCPYVDHLISSFNKHYGQSLETIQEEDSFCLSNNNKKQETGKKIGKILGTKIRSQKKPKKSEKKVKAGVFTEKKKNHLDYLLKNIRTKRSAAKKQKKQNNLEIFQNKSINRVSKKKKKKRVKQEEPRKQSKFIRKQQETRFNPTTSKILMKRKSQPVSATNTKSLISIKLDHHEPPTKINKTPKSLFSRISKIAGNKRPMTARDVSVRTNQLMRKLRRQSRARSTKKQRKIGKRINKNRSKSPNLLIPRYLRHEKATRQKKIQKLGKSASQRVIGLNQFGSHHVQVQLTPSHKNKRSYFKKQN